MVRARPDPGRGYRAVQSGPRSDWPSQTVLRLCREIEGRGRDEDVLAYWRDEQAYRNLLLLEQPNGDFAMTMVRQLLYAAFLDPYF